MTAVAGAPEETRTERVALAALVLHRPPRKPGEFYMLREVQLTETGPIGARQMTLHATVDAVGWGPRNGRGTWLMLALGRLGRRARRLIHEGTCGEPPE